MICEIEMFVRLRDGFVFAGLHAASALIFAVWAKTTPAERFREKGD